MPVKCKSKPVNTTLYNSIKTRVKNRVKRWPSAYASGQLVNEYKRQGGKYRCSKIGQPRCSKIGQPRCSLFGDLDRWFKEKWIDVCTGKPCGRKRSSGKNYPYCRPSRKVSQQTPLTGRELSRSEIKKRCAIKHKIKGKTLRHVKFLKNFN